MFDNIGRKIKTVAKITCVLGIVTSILAAILLWMTHSPNNPTLLIGTLVLVCGPLASWTGSFFTYGFGELIENTEAIRKKLTSNGESTPKVHHNNPSKNDFTRSNFFNEERYVAIIEQKANFAQKADAQCAPLQLNN